MLKAKQKMAVHIQHISKLLTFLFLKLLKNNNPKHYIF